MSSELGLPVWQQLAAVQSPGIVVRTDMEIFMHPFILLLVALMGVACSGPQSSQPEDPPPPLHAVAADTIGTLRFVARSRLATAAAMDSVHVEVVVENMGDREVLVGGGVCSTPVWVYRNPDRSGVPVYDSSRDGLPCQMILVQHLIPPGGMQTFGRGLAPADLLAPGEGGRFYITAALKLELVASRPETQPLLAGELELRR